MSHYETICLDDYVQSGEGGTALTYNHKDGHTLAKLFMPGLAAETAEREFHVNEVVYASGLPTPRPIRPSSPASIMAPRTKPNSGAGKRSSSLISP